MNPSYIFTIVLFSITLFLGYIQFTPEPPISSFVVLPDTTKITPPANEEISFVVVGDLMCHSPQFLHAKQPDGSYDFFPHFTFVEDFLKSQDFTFGNLETVLLGKSTTPSGYPHFNTPNSYADALQKLGFDLVVTANNHSYDQGAEGIVRTLDELQKRNLPTEGTYRTQAAADSIHVYSLKGLKFSILAYTQFSNTPLPSKIRHQLNHIDTVKVKEDILKARALGAELVVIHYHWGQEYLTEPDYYQVEIAKKTQSIGADIIIGGHPHYIQPIQRYKTQSNASLDTGFIAYSLGNFISNQMKRYSDSGVMLKFVVEKSSENGKIRLKSIQVVPTWVYKGAVDKKTTYRILPSQLYDKENMPALLINALPDSLDFLTSYQMERLKQSFSDSKRVLTLYDSFPEVVYWKDNYQLPYLINGPYKAVEIPHKPFTDSLLQSKR